MRSVRSVGKVFAFILILSFSTSVRAEVATTKLICDKVMPSLLEFTGSLITAMDQFEDLRNNQMNKQPAETFAQVAKKGQEMKALSGRYQKSFITACFGN